MKSSSSNAWDGASTPEGAPAHNRLMPSTLSSAVVPYTSLPRISPGRPCRRSRWLRR